MLNFVCNIKLKKLYYFIITLILCYFIIQVFVFISLRDDVHFIPKLIWWNQFINIKNDRIITCSDEAYRCLISNNRTIKDIGAFLFYGSHIENHDFPLPRNYSIPWAIFHEESPKNYAPFLFEETQTIFNFTSTFSRYSDFPVTLQYLEDLDLIKDTTYYVPVVIKNKYLEEIAPILYIQSDCDTPINRDYFVEELGKHVKIDSYGKCLTNKKFPKELSEIYTLDLYNEELLKFISKYKFIIAFENSVCDDYITEKLWRALIVGSIPIYLGSPTIEDWLPNKNSAILVKNYNTMEDVANLIKKINENDTLYNTFLEHKVNQKISNTLLEKSVLKDHPIPSFECFVCEQLHKKDDIINNQKRYLNVYNCPKPNSQLKGNTWYQHWDIGKCQSKALGTLLARNVPYRDTLFENTWKSLYYNKDC